MSPERENESQRESVGPIRPSEVDKAKKKQIPAAVFETFNDLIVQNDRQGYSCFRQDDVVEMLVRRGLDRNLIFKNGWLDIEDSYRDAGWEVRYDSPAYNESYPATFEFSRIDRKRRLW
jgi:hypothetical protein